MTLDAGEFNLDAEQPPVAAWAKRRYVAGLAPAAPNGLRSPPPSSLSPEFLGPSPDVLPRDRFVRIEHAQDPRQHVCRQLRPRTTAESACARPARNRSRRLPISAGFPRARLSVPTFEQHSASLEIDFFSTPGWPPTTSSPSCFRPIALRRCASARPRRPSPSTASSTGCSASTRKSCRRRRSGAKQAATSSDENTELGGRGQLPTRGSHGSGRAPFGHPAPQMMVSLLNGTHCARLAPRGGDRCCVGARSGPMSCGPASFAGRAICATAVPLRIGIGSTPGSCR